MLEMPEPGLYRTTQAYPGHEDEVPADVLVYVGVKPNGGVPFVVRPGRNEKNTWFYGEPVLSLRALNWAATLTQLPPEGFYTLPDDLSFDGGGRWLKGAIVQLGFNAQGQGILFVGERHDEEERNVLVFGDRGRLIDDKLMGRLTWAPILPVADGQKAAGDAKSGD